MYASYHNHTKRCRHATGTDEEYLIAAIRAGYKIFGFSDHAPHAFRPCYSSRGRMGMDELSKYVEGIRSLGEKYKNDITVRIGLEAEYLPALFAEDCRLYSGAGVEYLVLGQHVLGNESLEKTVDCFAKTTDPTILTKYADTVVAAVGTGKFSFVAHPDVLNIETDPDFYRQEADRIIRAAKRANIPLEVNLQGVMDGRNYPNPLFWERARLLGADVILGIDAHSPELVSGGGALDLAYRFIEKHQLNER